MANIRPSYPNNYKIVDQQGVLTPQWNYFLRAITNQLPDPTLPALQTTTGTLTIGDLTPILDPIYVNISGDSMTGGLAVPSLTIAGTTVSFPISNTNGGTGLSSIGTSNQVLSVNPTSTALEYKSFTSGSGISIVPTVGNYSISNTGVLSASAGSGIGLSGSTGNITITNNGVTNINNGIGIGISGSTGIVTISNTGVTSLIAGSGIFLSGSSGSVTISSTSSGPLFGSGQVSLNLGSFPGGNEAQVTVTGLTSISSTATCFAKINGDSTSVSYSANDHRYLAGFLNLSCSSPIAGSGFIIYSTSLEKLSGFVTVNYYWQN